MAISVVRRSLMIRFVRENIGLNALTRKQFINRHITDFANALYNADHNIRKTIVVVDGTYSYIEKSGNYKTLQQSYSVQFLEAGERQLPTERANEARIVTFQRWIVEAQNGHIKSIFHFLDGIIPKGHVLHLREFYLIAGTLINKYHNTLFSWREKLLN